MLPYGGPCNQSAPKRSCWANECGAMSVSKPGLFITGCDTDIGKTFVAALITRQLRNEGYRVGVYKPVASGCRLQSGTLVSDDACALWEAAGRPGTLDEVCPQRFVAPLAPYLAARAEGREIDRAEISRGLDRWRITSDIVIVEGAGGLMSPISDNEYNAQLASEFGYPLVVVAANRIGVIHQVLATLAAAADVIPPLPVAGVVLNRICNLQDESIESNRSELARRIKPPVLANLAYQANQLAEPVDWYRLALGQPPIR